VNLKMRRQAGWSLYVPMYSGRFSSACRPASRWKCSAMTVRGATWAVSSPDGWPGPSWLRVSSSTSSGMKRERSGRGSFSVSLVVGSFGVDIASGCRSYTQGALVHS